MDPKQGTLEQEHLQNASSDQIRHEIRNTRQEMDDTLDQLGERLHPRHLLDDLVDLFRGPDSGAHKEQIARSVKGAGRTVARELKAHPLPALLVGAGLAWWLYDSMGGDEEDIYGSAYGRNGYGGRSRGYDVADVGVPPRVGYDPQTATEFAEPMPLLTVDESSSLPGQEGPGAMDKAKGMAAKAGGKVSGAVSAAGDKLSGAASQVGDKMSSAASGIKDRMSQAGHRAGSALHGTAHRAGSALHGTAHTAGQYGSQGGRAIAQRSRMAGSRMRSMGDEYPLAAGAAFLAAGLLAGLLLPRTQREDQWLGEASDELFDHAKETGRELAQRGKAVLNETAAVALDEAEARGATPGSLAEKAGRVLSEAVRAGKEAAKEEGISGEDLKETAKAVGHTVAETAQTRAKEEVKEVVPQP